jgi:plastocyanin
MKGLVALLVVWFGAIGGGLLLNGHEQRLANFLTAATAKAGGAGGTGGTITKIAGTATAGAGGASITIKMKDFSFDPNTITAPAGKLTLTLQNWGRYTHDFRIHTLDGTGELATAGRVGAGFAHTMTVTLTPGTYSIDCSVSNHAKRGMTGTITVAG